MPKLLIFSGFYPTIKGGAEYQMKMISEEIKENFDIVFVYLGDAPLHPNVEDKVEFIDGYKVYSIKTCSKYDNLLLKKSYLKRIFNVIELEKPDVIYQRVYKFISFFIARKQKKLGYKYIIHIADLFTIDFKNSSLGSIFRSLFFKATVRSNPKFVVQTKEQGAILSSYAVQSLTQIYNYHPQPSPGISKEMISCKYNREVKNIVWVANIKKIKQLEVFLYFAEKLKDNDRYIFNVIGDIQDPAYSEPLIKIMTGMKNIKHYTNKDNVFVNEFLLNEASLVVNTSVSEGFSNVFIQSWLHGVPVVSLNSNPDGIFDSYSDFGVFCNNDKEYALKMIIEVLHDKNYVSAGHSCNLISNELFSSRNISNITHLITE